MVVLFILRAIVLRRRLILCRVSIDIFVFVFINDARSFGSGSGGFVAR